MLNMKYIKSYRANNIDGLEESGIREKEFIFQETSFELANQPIEEITYLSDGSIEHIYKYKYDERGNVVDEILEEGDGEVTEHRSMEYDKDGKIVKEYVHYLDGSADQLIFTYDGEGRLVGKKNIDSEGESGNYFEITFNGKLLGSETEYDSERQILTQQELSYDEEGRLIEEFHLTQDGSYTFVMDYDENGSLSVRRRYDAEGHLLERSTYNYNADGRLAEAMEETGNGIEITVITYDEAGNMLLQEEKTQEGELRSHIERTYNEQNQLLTTSVVIQRPGQQVPQNYRIRFEYE